MTYGSKEVPATELSPGTLNLRHLHMNAASNEGSMEKDNSPVNVGE